MVIMWEWKLHRDSLGTKGYGDSVGGTADGNTKTVEIDNWISSSQFASTST